MNGGIDVFCDELPQEPVSLSVASYDTSSLPELDFVQELTTRYSYLANEQLKEVVGG